MRASSKEKILLAVSDPEARQQLLSTLKVDGFEFLQEVNDVSQGEHLLESHAYSLVLIDIDFSMGQGLYFLERVVTAKPGLPILYLAPAGNVDVAVEAVKRGAFGVLEMPLDNEKMRLAVGKALEARVYRTEMTCINRQIFLEDSYHGLVGCSPAIRSVFSLIERIRESSVNILITGPSGSGKEMIARALHDTSPRHAAKFVAINCSAIPDALLEGELFGYKKGAFTDARTDKLGLFQEAQNGTIFLDEIGDMPLTIQPKILRAIQEKEVRPLGAIQSIKVDVRIIAATNRNLQEEITQRHFREDLYYRLNAMQIDLPSLKDRPEDIPLLVEYFVGHFRTETGKKLKGVSQKALKKLMEHAWPGNVRELENVIERAALLTQGDVLTPEDLLFADEEDRNRIMDHGMPYSEIAKCKLPLKDVERDYILQVLRSTNGNRSETAKILGIGRKTLYNKLAIYNI